MGRASLLFYIMGGAFLFLFAPLLALMAFVVLTDEAQPLPSGPHVIEGKLVTAARARGPIGEPFTFGYVRISVNYGYRPHDRSHSYVEEDRGTPRVTLETEAGPKRVTLADPWRRFRGFRAEERRVFDIRDIPEAQPDWPTFANTTNYWMYVLAVRPGDVLLVEMDRGGVATHVWKGGRSAAEARAVDRASDGRYFGAGSVACSILALVGGIGLIFAGSFSRRRHLV
jgi:hypothetical protein